MTRAPNVRRRLDVVDQVIISSPCTVPWEGMRGDDRVRFCGQCRQNVYNVESLDRGEARRLIAAREGRVCLRILRRDDGTVVTADCWTRLRAARRRGVVAFVAMLVVVGFAQLWAMRFGLRTLTGAEMGAPPSHARIEPPAVGGIAPPSLPEPPRIMGVPPPAPPKPPRVTGHTIMGRRVAPPLQSK
jgi:hypothetical protein